MDYRATKLFSIMLAILLVTASTTAVMAATPGQQTDQTIVDIAVADGRFSTLVTALQAADLVDTLNSDGPFTVFAPTDEAFAALPAGTIDSLLADIPALTDVLLYHVVPGRVPSADVMNLLSADTVLGQPVSISFDGKTVTVGNAQVIITDIEASNGIIHVIDAVLLPPAAGSSQTGQTIVDIAVADGRFTTLVTALQAAGLVDTLNSDGPFTVFAPTDEAFAALPDGTLDSLLADIPTLTDILLYHVVPGKILAADLVNLSCATTVCGQTLHITVDGNTVKVNDAQIIITDIEASNGVIHVIDAVLLPSDKDSDNSYQAPLAKGHHYNPRYGQQGYYGGYNNHNRYGSYYGRGYYAPRTYNRGYSNPRTYNRGYHYAPRVNHSYYGYNRYSRGYYGHSYNNNRGYYGYNSHHSHNNYRYAPRYRR